MDKVQEINRVSLDLLTNGSMSAGCLQSVVGLMASCYVTVPVCLCRLRPFTWHNTRSSLYVPSDSAASPGTTQSQARRCTLDCHPSMVGEDRLVLSLLVDLTVLLPVQPSSIRNPQGLPHPSLSILWLAAWCLSGKLSK